MTQPMTGVGREGPLERSPPAHETPSSRAPDSPGNDQNIWGSPPGERRSYGVYRALSSPRQSPRSSRSPSTPGSDEAVALVQQEMDNLKALKRLSIASLSSPFDPDLPNASLYDDPPGGDTSRRASFGPGSPPRSPPSIRRLRSGRIDCSFDERDERQSKTGVLDQKPENSEEIQETNDKTNSVIAALEPDLNPELLWVPARVHPELAPNEWLSFVQNKVEEIRTSVRDRERQDKSRLSHEIEDQNDYVDASELLEKRRSQGSVHSRRHSILELSSQLKDVGELESLATPLSPPLAEQKSVPVVVSPPPATGASLQRTMHSRRRPRARRLNSSEPSCTESKPDVQPVNGDIVDPYVLLKPRYGAAARRQSLTRARINGQDGSHSEVTPTDTGISSPKNLHQHGEIKSRSDSLGHDNRSILTKDSTDILDRRYEGQIEKRTNELSTGSKPQVWRQRSAAVTRELDAAMEAAMSVVEDDLSRSNFPTSPTPAPCDTSKPKGSAPQALAELDSSTVAHVVNSVPEQPGESVQPVVENAESTSGAAVLNTQSFSFSTTASANAVQAAAPDNAESSTLSEPERKSEEKRRWRLFRDSGRPEPVTSAITSLFKKKKKDELKPTLASTSASRASPRPLHNMQPERRKGHSRSNSRASNHIPANAIEPKSKMVSHDSSQYEHSRKHLLQSTERYKSRRVRGRHLQSQEQELKAANLGEVHEPIKPGSHHFVEAPLNLPYEIPVHQQSDRSFIMMRHRFPLHIERAIYRLSHMKLANPRRPLLQQVLLSNFMYAYLNLINQGYQQQLEAQRLPANAEPAHNMAYGYVSEPADDLSQSSVPLEPLEAAQLQQLHEQEIVSFEQPLTQGLLNFHADAYGYYHEDSSSSSSSGSEEEAHDDLWEDDRAARVERTLACTM